MNWQGCQTVVHTGLIRQSSLVHQYFILDMNSHDLLLTVTIVLHDPDNNRIRCDLSSGLL